MKPSVAAAFAFDILEKHQVAAAIAVEVFMARAPLERADGPTAGIVRPSAHARIGHLPTSARCSGAAPIAPPLQKNEESSFWLSST
jgi:hypothetical protein